MPEACTQLYILRHGQAQMAAPSDAARCLTNFGRQQVQAQACAFIKPLSLLNAVYVSPYVRAQQSADELFTVLGSQFSGQRHMANWLTPDTPLELALEALETVMVKAPILLVSHQPLVSYLMSHLSGKPAWQLGMDTASLACLSVPVVAQGFAQLISLTAADVAK